MPSSMRRRVVCLAMGSQGDVRPHLALARRLADDGHDTLVVGIDTYAGLAARVGVPFVGLPVPPVPPPSTGREAWLLERSPSSVLRLLHGYLTEHADAMARVFAELVEASDIVVTGSIMLGGALALAEDRGCRVVEAAFAPTWPTAYGESGVTRVRSGGHAANLRLGRLIRRLTLDELSRPLADAVRRRLGRGTVSTARLMRAAQGIPGLLACAPELVPAAADWPEGLRQTGPWLLPDEDQRPPAALADFLASGRPPVYVGFGSIPSRDPGRSLDTYLGAAKDAGVRVIVRAPDNELPPAPIRVDGTAMIVGNVSHGWLFPRVAGAVHHGGAGTTQAALLSGVPQAIVPLGFDQPYFAGRVHALGLGPEPVPFAKLTRRSLAGLLGAMDGGRFTDAASRLSVAASAHDGVGEAAAALNELTD